MCANDTSRLPILALSLDTVCKDVTLCIMLEPGGHSDLFLKIIKTHSVLRNVCCDCCQKVCAQQLGHFNDSWCDVSASHVLSMDVVKGLLSTCDRSVLLIRPTAVGEETSSTFRLPKLNTFLETRDSRMFFLGQNLVLMVCRHDWRSYGQSS